MSNTAKPAKTAQYLRQDGRTAVVTGTGGLGFEVATKLAALGERVIIAGRNGEKGQDAVARIAAAVPGADVRFEVLDLASLASVKDFTGRMTAQGGVIDLLVNNAGIMSPPQRRVTVDGFEAQFATNHLGHFALTAGLLPLLKKSCLARVVSVTSIAHRYGRMDLVICRVSANISRGLPIVAQNWPWRFSPAPCTSAPGHRAGRWPAWRPIPGSPERTCSRLKVGRRAS